MRPWAIGRHGQPDVFIALLWVAWLGLVASPVSPEPLEPPPESPEGADYAAEPADSLDGGLFELGLGASGRAGGEIQRRRRVRFADDELRGTVREGRGDPLAGGSVEGRSGSGDLTLGRLAPRWGRGLLVGSPADPWQRTPTDRGPRATFRGRAGEGALYRHGDREGVELLAGRFARRDLAGLKLWRSGLALGLLAGTTGEVQGSLSRADSADASEWAWDLSGRWRVEGLAERNVGQWVISVRARGGHQGFRSLAEPLRSGPARALAVGGSGPAPWGRAGAVAALWRFRSGRAGARLALEGQFVGRDRAVVAWGVEEQHGLRREVPSWSAPFRQGAWGEWRRAARPLRLSLRHEMWGERAWARGVTRAVTTVRLEASAPAGIGLAATHSVFHSKRGESLYLPEGEIDRLVLRAVSGEGERSRFEARVPIAGGRISAALELATAAAGRKPSRWSVDFTRRGGKRGSRSATSRNDSDPPPL
ncbi:MAG TPA: hypothetical protein VGK93_03040 [Candidatus Eisenbacteria bacterium]|jgi:hypothetical protein